MIFTPTGVAGVVVVDVEAHRDERGAFARTFCADEFATAGLPARFVQGSVSANARRLTLRGMHFQAAPHGEGKLVRCTHGTIFDVALDLRPDSPTFRRWHAAELSRDNRRALFMPEGVAHGFLTLEDECEVSYLMTAPFVPGSARGVRWDDPAFAIVWPHRPEIISERDRAYPDFVP